MAPPLCTVNVPPNASVVRSLEELELDQPVIANGQRYDLGAGARNRERATVGDIEGRTRVDFQIGNGLGIGEEDLDRLAG